MMLLFFKNIGTPLPPHTTCGKKTRCFDVKCIEYKEKTFEMYCSQSINCYYM
jgi:hypothetical protein